MSLLFDGREHPFRKDGEQYYPTPEQLATIRQKWQEVRDQVDADVNGVIDELLAEYGNPGDSHLGGAIRALLSVAEALSVDLHPGPGDLAVPDAYKYLIDLIQIDLQDLRAGRPPADRGYRKKEISHTLRKQVYERDMYRCTRCGDWHDLSIDHIIAEFKGGPTVLENLQTLCRPCNSSKGVKSE